MNNPWECEKIIYYQVLINELKWLTCQIYLKCSKHLMGFK